MRFPEIRKALAPHKNKKNPPICVMMNEETIRYYQFELLPCERVHKKIPYPPDNIETDLYLKRIRCRPLPVVINPFVPYNTLLALYSNTHTRTFKITEKPLRKISNDYLDE